MSADVAIYCSNVAGQWVGTLKDSCCYGIARVFSPYITSSLAEQALEAIWPDGIEVYTRFEIEAFAAGASSLSTLKTLKEKGYRLFHVPRLHAKVFDHPQGFATVGSQNLTQQGTRNREATVLIRDPGILALLRHQLNRWVADRRPITMEMILEAEKQVVLLRKEFRRLKRTCRRLDKQVFSAQSERDKQDQAKRLHKKIKVPSAHFSQNWLPRYQEGRQVRLNTMGNGISVPYDFCRNIAWNATEWDHPKGKIVAARRDANHLRKGLYGWELPLGENRFGVELVIKWCREKLSEMFPVNVARSFTLTADEITHLQTYVRAGIIGHRDRLYRAKYPVRPDGRMKLGTHFVNPANTVAAILHFSEFERPA